MKWLGIHLMILYNVDLDTPCIKASDVYSDGDGELTPKQIEAMKESTINLFDSIKDGTLVIKRL